MGPYGWGYFFSLYSCSRLFIHLFPVLVEGGGCPPEVSTARSVCPPWLMEADLIWRVRRLFVGTGVLKGHVCAKVVDGRWGGGAVDIVEVRWGEGGCVIGWQDSSGAGEGDDTIRATARQVSPTANSCCPQIKRIYYGDGI